MSKLKLQKMEGFYTPSSMKEVQDWVKIHPENERMHLMTAVAMTWNFAADMVDIHNEYGGDSVSTGDE